MKKLIPLLIVGVFILSSLGASAAPSLRKATDPAPAADYTHTVLVEVGTATWCPSCPASNAMWHTIYSLHQYNFEYTELVDDMSPAAHSRFYQFNPKYVPTSYFDGGQFAYPGTSQSIFENDLNSAGARVVPNLESTLTASWLGSAQVQISYNVDNLETSAYPGHLRIYVSEFDSRWNDNSGKPYHHALLSFAEDKQINIPASGSISDTIVWDGNDGGYSDVDPGNLQVILAVFNATAHTGFSDPPSGNPFNAYYTDECIATNITQNLPPAKPSIQGPTVGLVGTSYNYTVSTTDPDGDDVYYCFDWNDGSGGVCMGPYPSGQAVTVGHAWSKSGTYNVKVVAHDPENAESEPGTIQVKISSIVDVTITGGLGVTATIKNNLATDLTNVHWSIALDGKLIFVGKSKEGTFNLAAGASTTVKDFIVGFGKTDITVQVDNLTSVTVKGNAFLFFLSGVD